jgi:pyruvate formate lyase activating enzyme
MEALYYERIDGKTRCTLCPHLCLVSEGNTGICKVRRNIGGKLIAETWGKLSGLHHDPVEKKPLYHFYPGSHVLSIGSVGCNMRCKCCQNWQISQTSIREYHFDRNYLPSEIAGLAKSDIKNLGIAYTYNEPGMWFEYMMETAQLIQEAGLKNIMVSNGFISEKPLDDLLRYIDAFNIDIKGFTEEFYRKFTGSSLQPVLQSLRQIRKSGRHLELTCLVVPGQNDDPVVFREMTEWIYNELGPETILHISRYHPAYKMGLESTSAESMENLLNIAVEKLNYVYAGNIYIKNFQDTACSKCHTVVIKRAGYDVEMVALSKDGACSKCGNKIIIM